MAISDDQRLGEPFAASPVVPYVQLVPCGLSEDKKHLLVSAVFTPERIENAGDTGFMLSNWITDLTHYLKDRNWSLNVSIARLPLNELPLPRIVDWKSAIVLKATARHLKEMSKNGNPPNAGNLADLRDLWAETIEQNSTDPQVWATLSELLTASLGGERVRPGEIETARYDDKYRAPKFGMKGQLTGQGEKNHEEDEVIDTILAFPQSDLAALLDRQRADEFATSLCEAGGNQEAKRKEEKRHCDRVVKKLADEEEKEKNDINIRKIQSLIESATDKLKRLETRLIVKDPGEGRKKETTLKAWKEEVANIGAEIRSYEKQLRHNKLYNNLSKRRIKARDYFSKAKTAQCKRTQQAFEVKTQNKTASMADDDFDKACDVYCYATWEQFDDKIQKHRKKDPVADNMRAYFAIQSNPSIARLFGLVVDLEIPLNGEELQEFLSGDPMSDTYLAISCSLRQEVMDGKSIASSTKRALPWTLCRYSHTPDDPKAISHFWPADIAEVGAISTDILPSRDGRVVMAAGWNPASPDDHKPRFDLTSIDVRGATEMEMQRRGNREEAIRTEKYDQFNDDLAHAHTLQTHGFTLLDKLTLQMTTRKLAAMQTKSESSGTNGCIEDGGPGNPPNLLLEASDITIGQRLDVGVPNGNGTVWRPLLSRIARYSNPTRGSGVEVYLKHLVGPPSGDKRMGLESPPLTQASRLLPRGVKEGETNQRSEAVIEEAMALWDGGPMGVYCGRKPMKGEAGDLLPFGRRLSVPTSRTASAHLPPNLRYGWPYRFSMRNVFIGGTAVPVAKGSATGDLDTKNLAYPGWGSNYLPFQRFLRQSRLASPQILLGHKQAVIAHGQMGFETGHRMVIRSARMGEGELLNKKELNADLRARSKPNRAQRIIVVPSLAQDEIARHGALPNKNEPQQPRGAFGHMKLLFKPSTFPVAQTKKVSGFDQVQYIRSRKIVVPPMAAKGKTASSVEDPVMQMLSGRDKTDSYYFPDPAAAHLVLALRRRKSPLYLGEALSINIEDSVAYPDKLPVILTMTKKKHRDAPVTSIKSLGIKNKKTYLNPNRVGDMRVNSSRQPAWDLEFALAPGEEFELDMWFVPSVQMLARSFAIIESLATLGTRRDETSVECTTALIEKGLADILPKDMIDSIIKEFSGAENAEMGFVAPEGVIGPSPKILVALATAVHKIMLQRPVSEIAAITKTELVHAVNRPKNAPTIKVPKNNFSTKKDEEIGEDGLEPLMVLRPLEMDKPDREMHFDYGSNTFLLHGSVAMDFCDADVLEIIGQVALPPASDFDNSANHRSLIKKRGGVWPTYFDLEGKPQNRVPSDVFGFNVDRDTGHVSFDKSQQILLRIDDLTHDGDDVGIVTFPIAAFFTAPPQEEDKPCRVVSVSGKLRKPDGSVNPVTITGQTTQQFRIDDHKARDMKIHARSISRTAGLFDTRNIQNSRGEFIPSRPLVDVLQITSGAKLRLILPATKRSAKCSALTPHPVFHYERDVHMSGKGDFIRIVRKSMIRIRLGRGWFSNGDGERIGLVLWPPNLDLKDTSGMEANRVPVPSPSGKRYVELSNFSDDDLGPGGKFITRIGADPVRSGPRDVGHFLSLADFPQLPVPNSPTAKDADIEYIPNVIMPLDDDAGEASADIRTMQVGLISLKPSFDMEEEIWYADVEISAQEATDPFLRLGLVRFQPNTSNTYKVSNPVTQWVQILPSRTVTVTRDKDENLLNVEVEGQASTGMKTIQHGDQEIQEAYSRPLIHAVLVHETKHAMTGAKRETRMIVPEEKAFALLTPPINKEARALWRFKIPRLKLESEDSSETIALYLEEVEMRRPATYPVEPVTPEMLVEDDVFVPSGPRSSSRIELNLLLTSG